MFNDPKAGITIVVSFIVLTAIYTISIPENIRMYLTAAIVLVMAMMLQKKKD